MCHPPPHPSLVDFTAFYQRLTLTLSGSKESLADLLARDFVFASFKLLQNHLNSIAREEGTAYTIEPKYMTTETLLFVV